MFSGRNAKVSVAVPAIAKCAAAKRPRFLDLDPQCGTAFVDFVLDANAELWHGNCVGEWTQRRVFGVGKHGLYGECSMELFE